MYDTTDGFEIAARIYSSCAGRDEFLGARQSGAADALPDQETDQPCWTWPETGRRACWPSTRTQ